MKKLVLLLLGVMLFSFQSQAQLTLKQKKAIKEVVEKKVPKLINNNQEEIKLLEIDKIRLGMHQAKLKGSLDVQLFEQELFKDPISFKTKMTYKKGKTGLKYLKVHMPGDKFLFFKRYRRVL